MKITEQDGVTYVALADEDDWEEFVKENREGLLEDYETIEAAHKAAREGGIHGGGGAAAEYHVYFEE